jgi:hypothetical protein
VSDVEHNDSDGECSESDSICISASCSCRTRNNKVSPSARNACSDVVHEDISGPGEEHSGLIHVIGVSQRPVSEDSPCKGKVKYKE